jgi:hypothetical protein
MRRFRFSIAIKYLILLGGAYFSFVLVKAATQWHDNGKDFIGLGIAAAGCFIAYALIDNNDVREANKD